MKKIYLLLSLFSLTICAYAQQTVQITNHPDHSPFVAHYEVLKADQSTKQGSYSLSYGTNNLMQTGYYKNNLKDSLWTSYTFNGKIKNKGVYKEGTKTGIWQYYINDTLENKYDFTSHELLYHRSKPIDSAEYYVITNHDTTVTRLSRPPLFLDGQQDLSNQISDRIIYLIGRVQSARGTRIMLLYTVAEDGKPLNVHVLRPGVPLYDKAAIECFNNVEGDWIPAILNGKPVAVLQVIPFNLNGSNRSR